MLLERAGGRIPARGRGEVNTSKFDSPNRGAQPSSRQAERAAARLARRMPACCISSALPDLRLLVDPI